MTDEDPNELRQRVREQEERIEQLESMVKRMMPNRRDVLKAGGAAAGAGLLGFGAGTASGSDTSSRRAGAPGDEVDVYLDELKDPSGDVVADVDDTGAVEFLRPVSVEEMANGWFYAGAYDGSDPDSRLDNALSDAPSEGSLIFLEPMEYSSNRSFGGITLVGTGIRYQDSTYVTGDWTVSGPETAVERVWLGGSITVDQPDCLLTKIRGNGSITFSSGTSGGVADTIVGVPVTDNGSNTIGTTS
ncbi:twin-arginine translocation signal domain-containing protein [Halomicrobium urmianum]|uniref:twin-arginine translocation signal domain-containing protein n=1 Tax=Halomicrobium urmianum TaxID=1586233 RepID=UPI001CDA1A16|nr:twin-arginine translocation signal domain-containing protein [Halomicrobium urmianum]